MDQESYRLYIPSIGNDPELEDVQYLPYKPTSKAEIPLLNGEPITPQDIRDRREGLKRAFEEREQRRKIGRRVIKD